MKKEEVGKFLEEIEMETGKRPCIVVIYNVEDENEKPIFSKALTCTKQTYAFEYLENNGYRYNEEKDLYIKKKGKKIANILETKLYK